jgi:hypothetical protein
MNEKQKQKQRISTQYKNNDQSTSFLESSKGYATEKKDRTSTLKCVVSVQQSAYSPAPSV